MRKRPKHAYIALGGNLSNPKQTFIEAIADMRNAEIDILEVSSLWHSPAWPTGLGYPDYLNGIIKIGTQMEASDLLSFLHEIEAKYGRERNVKNAPRPIDLDIIDFEGIVRLDNPRLPHPRVLQRPFVLLPLFEVAPEWYHPITRETGTEALMKLNSSDVLSHSVKYRDWLK